VSRGSQRAFPRETHQLVLPNSSTAKRCPGGEYHALSFIYLINVRFHPEGVVLHLDLLSKRLFYIEVLLALQGVFHGQAVKLLVGLGAKCLNRRSLACVQHPDLDEGAVNVSGHLAAYGVDLPHQMPFGRATDRGVARHKGHIIQVHGEKQGSGTHPGRSKSRLAAGMSCSNNNNIIHFFAHGVDVILSPIDFEVDFVCNTCKERIYMGRQGFLGHGVYPELY